MIRSTRHSIAAGNPGKMNVYLEFINDYSDYVKKCVDAIWRSGYEEFNIQKGNLNLPKMLNQKKLNFKSPLSMRAKSCAVDHASSIIRSCIEKQRRVLWVRENKNVDIKDKKFSKPQLRKTIYPRLNSLCCNLKMSDGKFFGFLEIKSIGKKYGKIRIPLGKNPNCEDGEPRRSFVLFERSVQISWDKKTKPADTGDKVIAIDQGMLDVATCSDGQTTPKTCPHGHSLVSITEKLSRKKRGSKSFERAQKHRKNFVNWSINQLNFDGVKEVRLEKVVNIRFRRKTSRRMSHWSNPEIRDKIKSRCEELEVPVVEQSSSYRSQRCSQCGNVRRANRKSKTYSCKNCGYSGDADYNAALNHLCDLPSVPRALMGQKLNLGNGFFWKPEGFFNFDGSELLVPDQQKLPDFS